MQYVCIREAEEADALAKAQRGRQQSMLSSIRHSTSPRRKSGETAEQILLSQTCLRWFLWTRTSRGRLSQTNFQSPSNQKAEHRNWTADSGAATTRRIHRMKGPSTKAGMSLSTNTIFDLLPSWRQKDLFCRSRTRQRPQYNKAQDRIEVSLQTKPNFLIYRVGVMQGLKYPIVLGPFCSISYFYGVR